MFEAEIFQFILHPPDPDPIGQWRIDLQGLLCDLKTLSLAEMLKRSHIMQSIGELDDHDADIIRHRQDHFAEILGLLLLGTLERDLPDFRHPIDKMHHILAELPFQLAGRRHRIFQRIVQQAGDDRRHIGFQRGQHTGHGNRMFDIGLSGTSRLAFMRLGRKLIGPSYHPNISVGLIRLDPLQQLIDTRDRFVLHRLLDSRRPYVSNAQLDSVMPVPVIELRRTCDIDRRLERQSLFFEGLHSESDTVKRHRPALPNRHL